ncbi:hypothetical protein [Methylobacterium sp. WL7]|uniref:hypothetical protein n=1 Tax=Methylobacterium sp. WL7 TaxID=2603900 RepID=UPI0011C8FE66|nr:hypothetical protein [Methylobacterium sp. WL7]TXN43597.1 hypothetical protein FV233_18030 [Methylobacterium sp. WL7]
MGIFATVDAANPDRVAFYVEGVSPSIPAGAFAVSEQDWQAYLADQAGHRFINGALTVYKPPAPTVPDNPTLGDWRVGLMLWGRIDDVTAKVAALVSSSDPAKQRIGKVASERLNYSNNVLRAQLLQLKDAFGFTAADVDESLYRAQRVSLGDLSGVWPLPAQG